jgi:hypothetical protein
MNLHRQNLINPFNFFCLISYLVIPITTIPFGVLIQWVAELSLPKTDILLIFHESTPLSTAIISAILFSPIYYLFVVFNRSEMKLNWQILTHLIFGISNLVLLFYVNYFPQVGLSAVFLVMLPQLLSLHILHFVWVHKYRDIIYRKLLSIVQKTRE